MPRMRKGTSTPRQSAYARRIYSGDGPSKKAIALSVGYAPNAANSVASKIESKPGFHNAMAKLAQESGDLALAVMEELKGRGLDSFSNAELIKAMNAMAGAWEKFTKRSDPKDPQTPSSGNRLRTIVLQQAEVIDVKPMPVSEKPPEPAVTTNI